MATQQTPNLPAPAAPIAVIAAGETSSSAIAAREKAAVEARFLVALNRPRDFDKSRLRLLTACQRPKFAAAARYAKPVGREKVFGFSIRFAEEARVLWGNIDVSAFLVFDDDERRIYRVMGTDLETNATESTDVMVEKFVERRQVRDGQEVVGKRTNSSGQIVFRIRATEDDLMVKVNALISKARRNVILSLIPADVKDECEARCAATLEDEDAKDPDAARRRMLEGFWSLGVTPQQIAEMLEKPVEQINRAEVRLMASYYTALKEGDATWADIVESHTGGKKKADAGAPAGKGTDALRETLGKKRQQSTSQAKAEQPETAAPTETPEDEQARLLREDAEMLAAERED